MNRTDEQIRNALTDSFTLAAIDARNLAVEVRDRTVTIAGTVPTEEQRHRLERLADALARDGEAVACRVGVQAVAPSDSLDGRGRSPVTGTSADSAHESRHQLDVE